MNSKRKIMGNQIAIQILFWFAWAFTSYQIVYFQKLGMTSTEIGVMGAVSSLTAMFSAILWGIIADKINSAKKALIWDLILSALLLSMIPFLPQNIKHGAVLYTAFRGILTAATGPIDPLLGNHAVRNCEEHKISYGTVRAFGTISATVGSFLCSLVMSYIDMKYSFWIASALMIPSIVLVIFSNDSKAEITKQERGSIGDARALLGNYYFLTFIVFIAIFQLVHNTSTLYVSFLMEEKNIPTTLYSTHTAVRTLTAIPFLFCFGWIRKKLKLKHILVLACTLMAMESLLFGLFVGTLEMLLISSAIYGIGNGLFLGATTVYVFKLAPDHLKASAQSLFGAISMGVGIIGNVLGGVVYGALGGSKYYTLSGVIMLGAVTLFALSLFVGRFARIANAADAEE